MSSAEADFPEYSAEQVLSGLREDIGPAAEKWRLVLAAELLDFDDSQEVELKVLLRDFIQEYRTTDDSTLLVAVCSAIRKFIAMLNPGELQSIAPLLERPEQRPLALEIKLEVAKMVVRKLVAIIPQQEDFLPELGERLLNLVKTHLDADLLGKDYHGAICLNSILALVLLRTKQMPEIYGLLNDRCEWLLETYIDEDVPQKRKVPAIWLKKQLVRRTEVLSKELATRSEAASHAHRQALKDFAQEMDESIANLTDPREKLSITELQEMLGKRLAQLGKISSGAEIRGISIREPITRSDFLELVTEKCKLGLKEATMEVKTILLRALQALDHIAVAK